jgi:putative hydrolase of the HAD superfamily
VTSLPRSRLRSVTFDCWGTLLYEPDPLPGFQRRLAALADAAAGAGARPAADAVRAALDTAWRRHVALWEQGASSGAAEIGGWALAQLGVADAEASARLATRLAEAALACQVLALDGARASLERLAEAGLRRALVCDTGFTPGRVVRQLLHRAGLLDLIEVCVFSDEAGVPKPHPSVFQAALAPLATAPAEALHVGDLRRTDVAGARGAGMGSVRIRWHHDDRSALPEADLVADSHAHLLDLLGL